MNSKKEVEYIAEIVALKSQVKALSLYGKKITDINAQLAAINSIGHFEWEFVQPSFSIETEVIEGRIVKHPNRTSPRIICRIIKSID